MKFLKYFIFSLLFVSLTVSLHSQENSKKDSKKSPKEKKIKENKPSKARSSKASSKEGSQNFGPVFDGAFVNLSVGTNLYHGDIAAYNLFPKSSQFSEHLRPAFKFSLGREIKWGLGAQLNYQRGSLIGTRKTGKSSSVVSFRNNFHDISLQVNYNLTEILFKKNEYNRFTLFGHLGIGCMWYRTQLFDAETLNTKDFEGYTEIENTQALSQKTLSDKVSKANSLVIPYGLRINYKYSYKMDIHLDITQSYTSTDRLDAFSRSWTAKDKYNYIGIGLTYNFNRSTDDAPKKKPKKDKTSDDDDDVKNSSSSKNNSKGFLGMTKRKKSDDDELLNIRLKLFETQLKLFEMQYLLGQ